MSYFVVGIAIVVLLALKCFLVKRNMIQSNERYMNPKSFAEEMLQNQLKKLGLDRVKKQLGPNNMIAIIRDNVNHLKSVQSSSNNCKQSIQKLRNVCLCIQLLQNPTLVEENPFKDEVKELNKSLIDVWSPWLSKNKYSIGLQGQMVKYFKYLSKHFS